MTNRLELNWSLDGFVDEQRYYCSNSPIDINNLPPPKMVFGGDIRTYIDAEITSGQTYYVRMSSVKNGAEKLSSETTVSTAQLFQYFRLYITANNGDSSFTAIQEIEMALTENGPDITTPSTPIAANNAYVGFEANKVLDNNFTDQAKAWISSGSVFPHHLTLSFAEIKNVVELRIWCHNTVDGGVAGQNRAPKDFVLQGSNNGVDWSNIRSFSNITNWSAGVAKKFNIINGTHN
ncbi:discoidin domain-containing protein [Acinetobacter johnsonii]|uniref:discoidin domain-containing protein n=1 Tax=Acinetobacter johnsonii TaxID=40214 RepID=UPI0032B3DCAC